MKKENNKLDEKDIEIENEKEMARKTPLKRRTREEQKAYFAKEHHKGREYRRIDDYESTITYPKNHTIKMPTSSPTFSITKLDEALDDIFKKKKR